MALRANPPTFTFVTNAATKYGALSYSWATNATDLLLTPQASGDFTSAFAGWEGISNVDSIISNGPTTELITVRDNQPAAASSKRFYKLNVQLEP